MAAALKGDIDAILITGGMAQSKRITDFMAEHISFIAPIFVYPGEDELKSLAENALAVITGEQEVKTYHSEDSEDPSKINDREQPSKIREILLAAITPALPGEKAMSAIRKYLRRWTIPGINK